MKWPGTVWPWSAMPRVKAKTTTMKAKRIASVSLPRRDLRCVIVKQRGASCYVPVLSTRMQALLLDWSKILFCQKLKDGRIGFAILFIRELAVAAALDRE